MSAFGGKADIDTLRAGTRFVDIQGNGITKNENGEKEGWISGPESQPLSKEQALDGVKQLGDALANKTEPIYSRFVDCWKAQQPQQLSNAA